MEPFSPDHFTTHHLTAILEQAGIPFQDAGVWGALNDRPLEYVTVPGKVAYQAWQAVRAVVSPQSHPLILPCNCYPLGQVFPKASDPAILRAIDAAVGLDLQQWWSDRWGDYDFENEIDEFEADEWSELEPADASEGGGTIATEIPDFTLTRDQLNLSHRPVWLTLFPQIPAWQIPLYLQYGDWNDCPLPGEHAAILAHWHRYYGAELFGLDESTLELWVAEPPTTEIATLPLAKEQFAYCEDIVSQGTMTVARLAQTLYQCNHWYFWWD
jgi:hypothetical protein